MRRSRTPTSMIYHAVIFTWAAGLVAAVAIQFITLIR